MSFLLLLLLFMFVMLLFLFLRAGVGGFDVLFVPALQLAIDELPPEMKQLKILFKVNLN